MITIKNLKTFLALTLIGLALHLTSFAQTDVTATYLTNADFNTDCNYAFDAVAGNLGSANDGANIQVISGWTIGSAENNSAASTFEYGYTGTLNSPGSIPNADSAGNTGSGQGTLGISVAWTASVSYYQNVTLPTGKYTLKYMAYNSGAVTADNSIVGFVPTSGSAALSSVTNFTSTIWMEDSISFTLTEETSGTIQVGLTAINGGSGSNGRIFFDDIKLIFDATVDKTDLQALVDSANNMADNGSSCYDSLVSTISEAQIVLDNGAATIGEVLTQEEVMEKAITIYTKSYNWDTLPYNITNEVIENPSFESGNLNGWTNPGGFWMQGNADFTQKDGNSYVEKWQSSSIGGWTDLKLYQLITDLPNGQYKLTASALNTLDVGGAYIYGNDSTVEVFVAGNYTVDVTVENNELEIGYEVVNGGNYVGTDNFQLNYYGTEPLIEVSESHLTCDVFNPTSTFTVSGYNLTEGISITAPTGFSVDNTTVGQSAGETTITATFDATAETKDYITITSSGVTERVRVLGYINTLTPLYPLATDLNSDPYMTEIDNFYGWGGRSITKDTTLIYSGISTGLISGGSLDCRVAFSPNTYYRVRAMVKAATSACKMGYYGGDADVNFAVDANNVGVWAPLDFTFQSDATTSLAEGLGIFFNGSNGSYVDNWEIYIMPMYVTADSIKFLEAGNAAVNVIAQALSGDVSITAPTAYSVSPSTITAGTIADVAITVTYDGTSNASGYIYLTGIDATDSVYVEGSISTDLVPQSASAPYLVFVNNDRINVNFELAQGANMQFAIYNMQGTLVATEQSTFSAGSHTKVLNADLSSGAYLINISKGEQSQTYKIIK